MHCSVLLSSPLVKSPAAMGVVSFFCALCCLWELGCSAVSHSMSVGCGAVMLPYEVLRVMTGGPILIVKMLCNIPDSGGQAHDLINSLDEQVPIFYTDVSKSQAAITGNSFL